MAINLSGYSSLTILTGAVIQSLLCIAAWYQVQPIVFLFLVYEFDIIIDFQYIPQQKINWNVHILVLCENEHLLYGTPAKK